MQCDNSTVKWTVWKCSGIAVQLNGLWKCSGIAVQLNGLRGNVV